ncbi:MAG: PorV/PorQ family protein, partial [bacterium]|nr:PorV/PorQ family protein [bacterium]
MKWMGRLLIPVIILLALAGGDGVAYASFKRGIGARALGMGQAFTAVADDPSAAYWNPAGLGELDGYHVLTMHDDLSFDRSFDYVGLTLPDSLGGTLGVGWQRFTVSGIKQYDSLRNYLGTFDDTEDMLTLSFGRRLTKWMLIGGNFKYFSQKLLSSYRGSGFGFDMGMMFNLHDQFDLALVLQDVGGNLKWKNTANEPEDEIPLGVRMGTAWRPRQNILFALDLEKEENMSVRTNYGVEAWFRERFGVRAGSNNGDFNIGASLVLGKWQLDYAYMSHELGEINRISARVRIDDVLVRESPRALKETGRESKPYVPALKPEVVEIPPAVEVAGTKPAPTPVESMPAIGEKWVEYKPDTMPADKRDKSS